MEENEFRIKKKYVFAALLIMALVLGYSLNAIFAKTPSSSQMPGITTSNSAMAGKPGSGNSDDMSSHHKPAQLKSTGFFQTAIGKQAPDFELQDMDGNKIKLSDYRGKNVILFFNEGSMCYPSCWNQITQFAKDKRFNEEDVIAFSIVVDSQSQWKQIMQKVPQMAGTKILFDTTKQVSADYDVLYTDSSMHKGSYPGHTYFVIDKKGIIRATLDDPRMAINNEEIASSLEKIKGA